MGKSLHEIIEDNAGLPRPLIVVRKWVSGGWNVHVCQLDELEEHIMKGWEFCPEPESDKRIQRYMEQDNARLALLGMVVEPFMTDDTLKTIFTILRRLDVRRVRTEDGVFYRALPGDELSRAKVMITNGKSTMHLSKGVHLDTMLASGWKVVGGHELEKQQPKDPPKPIIEF